MPAILGKDLRLMLEDRTKGPRWVAGHLRKALDAKQLVPEDFSLRNLAEELIPDGREYVSNCAPTKSAQFVTEAGADAVMTGHFANITGQIVYSKIMEQEKLEEIVFSPMIPTIPTEFDGEKIPGVSNLGDQAQIKEEGKAYATAGASEDWIDTPSTVERGLIVPITKEAIFFDRTGLVLSRCAAVGESLFLNKEKRIIDGIVDENTTAARYKWRGAIYATYVDTPWDNLAASNGLTDYTDIQAAETLLSGMSDPNTGEPLSMSADTLICTPELEPTAWRVLNTVLLAQQIGGYPTSGNVHRMDTANPVGRTMFSSQYKIVSSRQLARRMATDTSWFLGRPSAAFAYMQNWPVTVIQAPPNSEAEFTQNIVVRFRASERGAMATIQPRYMIKSTA